MRKKTYKKKCQIYIYITRECEKKFFVRREREKKFEQKVFLMTKHINYTFIFFFNKFI